MMVEMVIIKLVYFIGILDLSGYTQRSDFFLLCSFFICFSYKYSK